MSPNIVAIHAVPMRRPATFSSLRARDEDDRGGRAGVHCAACNLRDVCLPGGLEDERLDAFSSVV